MPGKISFIQYNITSLFPGKTPFQEGSFMKVNYLLLISLLIVGMLLIPAVSGEILNEDLSNHVYVHEYVTRDSQDMSKSISFAGHFYSKERESLPGIQTVIFTTIEGGASTGEPGSSDLKIYADEGKTQLIGAGVANHLINYNTDGIIKNHIYWFDIDTWNLGDISGAGYVIFDWNRSLFDLPSGYTSSYPIGGSTITQQSDDYDGWEFGFQPRWYHGSTGYHYVTYAGSQIIRGSKDWQNTVTLYKDGSFVNIDITKYDRFSYVTVGDSIGHIFYSQGTNNDVNLRFNSPDIVVNVTDIFGEFYTVSYPPTSIPDETTTNTVTVYVQNANTGALIADTNLSVNLYETETWYNSTLEWGWDTIQLPAGNYEFYAEKSGFTQYAPGRLTVDGVGDNINLLLYPDVVAPPAGNLTLQFWVCDSNLNGIPYAELSVLGLTGEGASFDSGIIQTNNLGYATLTAPGNSTYTAYASKPGYMAGENEFGVTTVSPVHIAVMLMAGEIPTNPTPTQPGVTPTVTPTVRPTDVAPGNNPIDNFRIIFLNMGFDDTYSDWLTGLFIICIGAALGYCLVKRVGAMCGAPIGLLTAVGLGLIPIWVLVLIIVIVALAYAKFFMGR